MAKPVCVVVGIGPGNGAALARRFAGEGYRHCASAMEPRSAALAAANGWEIHGTARAGLTTGPSDAAAPRFRRSSSSRT